MIKIIYITILVLYIGIIGAWGYRFPISFRIVGGDSSLITNRDLTNEGFESIDRSYEIRKIISDILIYSSLLLSVSSFVISRNKFIKPEKLVKIVMIVSGLIAVLLILINGIGFIPTGPTI